MLAAGLTRAGGYRQNTAAAMRVLIVPDKFKGTLAAPKAARAIARGWRRVRPRDRMDLMPMSDGGDGFGRILSGLTGARRRTRVTADAIHRPRRAAWWWESQSRTAIIESAEVVGLAHLPANAPHPFERDTTGLGSLLQVVARHQPLRCIIGVGGSATNDAGFGMARALGWRFLDRAGRELSCWTELASCVEILKPTQRTQLGRVTVAVDVANPLLGPRGCTRVYGPQKGMRPEDFTRAECSLRRLARLMNAMKGAALDRTPGAGAAGGLGYGLMAFLNARAVSGFDLFSMTSRLNDRIRRADLVLTGEGGLDDQSLMGKGVGRIATLCRQRNIPCIALVGSTTLTRARPLLTRVVALSPGLVSRAEAMRRPALHLARLAAQVADSRVWM